MCNSKNHSHIIPKEGLPPHPTHSATDGQLNTSGRSMKIREVKTRLVVTAITSNKWGCAAVSSRLLSILPGKARVELNLQPYSAGNITPVTHKALTSTRSYECWQDASLGCMRACSSVFLASTRSRKTSRAQPWYVLRTKNSSIWLPLRLEALQPQSSSKRINVRPKRLANEAC